MDKRWNVLVLAAPLLAACGGPQYAVVKTADPSGFSRPGCHAVLEPVHAERLMVDEVTEGQYVTGKSPESAASYAKDKSDSLAAFQTQLASTHGRLLVPPAAAGAAPDNTFILRPTWTSWSPGYYAAIVNKPGVAELTVDVLTASGQPVEEFTIKTGFLDFSSGGRMRGAMRRAGAIVGTYLDDRWSCAK